MATDSLSRQRRLRNIDAGAESGKVWLEALFRSGLGTDQVTQGFNAIEARMVDAQAGGLATNFWEMAELAKSGDGWQDGFVESSGLLYLLMDAVLGRDRLNENLRQDVIRMAGVNLTRKDLESEPVIEDIWDLAIQRDFRQQRLVCRRSWLFGRESRQWQFLLQYRISNARFEPEYGLGSGYRGRAVIYPGAERQRMSLSSAQQEPIVIPPLETFEQVSNRHTEVLLRCPWAAASGGSIGITSLGHEKGQWMARDVEGSWFPIRAGTHGCWRAAAFLNTQDLGLFGEWDGHEFAATSVTAGGGFYVL